MNYPILIIRKDDGVEFIHLENGKYRTKWGIMNGSIGESPFTAFDDSKFTFYYKD